MKISNRCCLLIGKAACGRGGIEQQRENPIQRARIGVSGGNITIVGEVGGTQANRLLRRSKEHPDCAGKPAFGIRYVHTLQLKERVVQVGCFVKFVSIFEKPCKDEELIGIPRGETQREPAAPEGGCPAADSSKRDGLRGLLPTEWLLRQHARSQDICEAPGSLLIA